MLSLGCGFFQNMVDDGGSEPPSISLVSGTGYAGSVLQTTTAGQWTADGLPIAGETGTTFTIGLEHEGQSIRCANSNAFGVWIPHGLTGASAVFDLRQGLTTDASSKVSAWDSQVGGLSATQSSTSAQPVLSATALDGGTGLITNGGSSLTLNVSLAPPKRCVVGVTNFAATSSNRTILHPSQAGGYQLRRNSSSHLQVLASGVTSLASSSSTIAENATTLVTTVFEEGGAYGFRFNGIDAGTGTAGNGLSGTGTMSLFRFADGVFGSLVIVDDTVVSADVERIEAWVAHTLGRLDLLSASHPYKTDAPLL